MFCTEIFTWNSAPPGGGQRRSPEELPASMVKETGSLGANGAPVGLPAGVPMPTTIDPPTSGSCAKVLSETRHISIRISFFMILGFMIIKIYYG